MDQNQNNNMEEHQLPLTEETLKELQEKIKTLSEQNQQYLEQLRKAKADVLRLEKEYQDKIEAMTELVHSNLVYALLSVLDSFELALKNEEEQATNQGFYLIYSQLKDILQKFHLQEIDALGQKLNPVMHEVISTKKCSKENCLGDDEGLIVEVLSRGYSLKGKILRPARVKVVTHE